MASDQAAPLIIDAGTAITKAGYAHLDYPSSMFDSFPDDGAGGPKPMDEGVVAEKLGSNYVKGKRPPCNSVLDNHDWMAMAELYHRTFYEKLNIVEGEHPVLITDSVLSPKSNREVLTQLMFESLRVPSMNLSQQAVLALYASGRVSGLVVDVGNLVTRVIPISAGCSVPYGVMSLNGVAGTSITTQLGEQLAVLGTPITSRTVLRDIKENLCYVALNASEELPRATNTAQLTRSYTLPDGASITISEPRFMAVEPLFQPHLMGIKAIGLSEMIYNTLLQMDAPLRNELYGHILITGGGSRLPGIQERVYADLTRLAPSGQAIKVVAPTNRHFGAWLGGSILAQLSTFQQTCVQKEEYDEVGPAIVHRKCF